MYVEESGWNTWHGVHVDMSSNGNSNFCTIRTLSVIFDPVMLADVSEVRGQTDAWG
jgi:hypothetical protein